MSPKSFTPVFVTAGLIIALLLSFKAAFLDAGFPQHIEKLPHSAPILKRAYTPKLIQDYHHLTAQPHLEMLKKHDRNQFAFYSMLLVFALYLAWISLQSTKKQRRLANAASKAKSDFLAMMSHEIRINQAYLEEVLRQLEISVAIEDTAEHWDGSSVEKLREVLSEEKLSLMITWFFEDVMRSLVILEDSLKQGDVGVFRITAHTLKSASQQLGAMSMGAIAAELEMQADALKPFNKPECMALIAKMSDEFAAVKPEYEKVLLATL